MKEKLKKEIEKLKKLTFKQKVQYIWEYYKVGILIFIFAAIFIGMFISSAIKTNPDAAHVAVCDMLPYGLMGNDEDTELLAESKLNEAYVAYTGMEVPKKLPLSVDTSYSLNLADNYMSTMMRQKLIAALGAQMIDIMIGTETGIKDYGSMNAFLDLREYLPDETVNMLDEKGLICKSTITPDTEDGGKPYEVYYGIKVDDMTVLTDSGYVTEGCVAALTGNPDKLDISVQFIDMLIDSLPSHTN